MTLELFNPFARYVVVKLQRRHFESEYGYTDCVDLITPVCFCEELEEAERIVFAMDDGRYEVRENAAWKTLEKHSYYFRAEGSETQSATAIAVLSDLLDSQHIGKPEQEAETVPEPAKCPTCDIFETMPGRLTCDMCHQHFVKKHEAERQAEYRARQRERAGAPLPSEELPDTPTATPTGHGVWTKS